MRILPIVLSLCAIAGGAPAQKDFLTADEADQLRLAQEIDPRIQLYLSFARQRIDLLKQLFEKNRTGRSGMIHDTLEQFTEIVETLDVVIDDALKRQRLITVLPEVTKTEREMMGVLEKFRESAPADLGRYKFVLDTAIEVARDSAEMAEEDLRTRTRGVEMRQYELRKEREAMMTPEAKEEAKKAEDKKAAEDAKQKKGPSLLRKGETLPSKEGKKQ